MEKPAGDQKRASNDQDKKREEKSNDPIRDPAAIQSEEKALKNHQDRILSVESELLDAQDQRLQNSVVNVGDDVASGNLDGENLSNFSSDDEDDVQRGSLADTVSLEEHSLNANNSVGDQKEKLDAQASQLAAQNQELVDMKAALQIQNARYEIERRALSAEAEVISIKDAALKQQKEHIEYMSDVEKSNAHLKDEIPT